MLAHGPHVRLATCACNNLVDSLNGRMSSALRRLSDRLKVSAALGDERKDVKHCCGDIIEHVRRAGGAVGENGAGRQVTSDRNDIAGQYLPSFIVDLSTDHSTEDAHVCRVRMFFLPELAFPCSSSSYRHHPRTNRFYFNTGHHIGTLTTELILEQTCPNASSHPQMGVVSRFNQFIATDPSSKKPLVLSRTSA